MTTLAAIKNELFNDYLKIVATDNLEATLDNPAVPVPFVCVDSVENSNADKLASEINKHFESRKLKGKDFLHVNEADVAQLHFLFNLVRLSSGGEATRQEQVFVAPVQVATAATIVEKTVEKVNEVKEEVVAPVVAQVEVAAPVVAEVQVEVAPEVQAPVAEAVEVEAQVAEAVVEVAAPVLAEVKVQEEVGPSADASEMIESLGIPKNSTVTLAKDGSITAVLVDEKTVLFDGEELAIVDATKKAFKKAGTTGMALGLANWNYGETSLKALKDKN